MHADLQTLMVLQQHDRTLRELHDELEAFAPEIAALDAEVSATEDALAAARRAVSESGERRTALEQKIENFRQAQERRRQRLEWVRGAKEAATLMAELDLGRSVLAKEEAEWVRSADKLQEAELHAAEAEKAVEEVKDAQASRRGEIAGAQAVTREKITGAEDARATAAKDVPHTLLSQYERIRKGRAPFALYALHGEACGHCYTAVPMHRRQELKNGRGIVTCEACGVMVYEEVPESA